MRKNSSNVGLVPQKFSRIWLIGWAWLHPAEWEWL